MPTLSTPRPFFAGGARSGGRPFVAGPLRLETESFSTFVDDRPVELTLAQFHILATLLRRPGLVFSADEIVARVQRQGLEIKATSLKSQVSALRKRLGHGGAYIHTVRGEGYCVRNEPAGPSDAKRKQQGQSDASDVFRACFVTPASIAKSVPVID